MTKVIDCITYFNEDFMLDLRFNILNDYVDYFVIVEATRTHQNQEKKLRFDINNFKKFKKKIIYLVQENINHDQYAVTNKKKGNEDHFRENSQRNYIMNGLKKFDDNDCIMISDCDEIPRPELILKNFSTKKIFFIFEQNFYYYKLNMMVNNYWQGTRMCAKKFLLSPNLLRLKKSKNKFFYNYRKNIKLINNGGWHFSYLQKPEDIVKKLESFCHKEFNLEDIKNIEHIKTCIRDGIDIMCNHRIMDHNKQKFIKKAIDYNYPQYIRDNLQKFTDWIVY